MPKILYFFTLCNLVIGSGAFILGGILQPVSTALGISVAAAGQAMTAYALATAVLAPPSPGSAKLMYTSLSVANAGDSAMSSRPP